MFSKTIEAEISISIDQTHTNADDYQQLLKISNDKQRQQLQEVKIELNFSFLENKIRRFRSHDYELFYVKFLIRND